MRTLLALLALTLTGCLNVASPTEPVVKKQSAAPECGTNGGYSKEPPFGCIWGCPCSGPKQTTVLPQTDVRP